MCYIKLLLYEAGTGPRARRRRSPKSISEGGRISQVWIRRSKIEDRRSKIRPGQVRVRGVVAVLRTPPDGTDNDNNNNHNNNNNNNNDEY